MTYITDRKHPGCIYAVCFNIRPKTWHCKAATENIQTWCAFWRKMKRIYSLSWNIKKVFVYVTGCDEVDGLPSLRWWTSHSWFSNAVNSRPAVLHTHSIKGRETLQGSVHLLESEIWWEEIRHLYWTKPSDWWLYLCVAGSLCVLIGWPTYLPAFFLFPAGFNNEQEKILRLVEVFEISNVQIMILFFLVSPFLYLRGFH